MTGTKMPIIPTNNNTRLVKIDKSQDKKIGLERQKKIMAHLHTWEYSTIKLLARILDIDYKVCHRNVKSLIKKGFAQEEKYLKVNSNYLIMLTDVGLAKLLGDSQTIIDNTNNETRQKILQKQLEQNQLLEMTATSLDKTNISLIKHNLYLQYFYHEIKQTLINNGVRITGMQNERQLIAQVRFDRKNISKQAQLDVIVARKHGKLSEIIKQLEAIAREKENEYRTIKGKHSDIVITALENNKPIKIAVELEITLKKDRELDHMFYHYKQKLESNELAQVIICSPMSLNPYIRYFEQSERFAIHKYNGKSNRYEIIDSFEISDETRQKFTFKKVNVDDSII
jgi:DNA-binding MarR family transcriptional regulator